MKKLLFVVSILAIQACGNSEPPKAPEPAASAADAAAPAAKPADAGAMVPDKK